MSFWNKFVPKKPKENVKQSFAFLTVCWAIMAIAIFLYVNVPDVRVPAAIFTFLALAAGFATAFGEISKGKIGFDYTLLGQNWKLAAIAGIIFGVIFVIFGGQSIVSSFSITISNNFINNLFFTGIAAPVFEELFFRLPMLYIFPFLLTVIFKLPEGFGYLMGIIGSSIAWASYHVLVLGANPDALLTIFVIGLIYAIGNLYIFRSVLFSFGGHLANNLLIVLRVVM